MPFVLTISWLLHQPSDNYLRGESGNDTSNPLLRDRSRISDSNDGFSRIRLIGDIFQRYFSSRDEDRIGELTHRFSSNEFSFHVSL